MEFNKEIASSKNLLAQRMHIRPFHVPTRSKIPWLSRELVD